MNKKQGVILGFFIGILIVAAIAYWYFSPQWSDNNGYPYDSHMLGGWGMPFGILAMGIFWFGVIYLVMTGFNSPNECRHNRVIDVLKSRLAKGEITIDEYEKLIEKLRDK
jgi:putative membrane protein